MFDDALLDSSPSRFPLLNERHVIISGLVGVLGSIAAFFSLSLLFPGAETKEIVARSLLLGIVLTLSMLMLCYVYASARHLRFRVWVWMAFVLVFNLIGFLGYLLYSAVKTGNWKRASVPAACCLEILLLAALVVVPLVHTEALPKVLVTMPMPPLPRGAPPAKPASPRIVRPASFVNLVAPIRIPQNIAEVSDQSAPSLQEMSVGLTGEVPGIPGEALNGVWNSPGSAFAAPPAPPQPAASKPKIIRIKRGGQVEPPRLLFQPKPEYPALARMARIEGVVQIEATISRDGTVEALRVVSGHPLLTKAAFDAVSRWRYEPTRLNGEPVEVVMEADVIFNLNN